MNKHPSQSKRSFQCFMSRTNTTTIEGLAVFLVAISVDLVILGTNWADDDLMQWAVVRFHVNDVPKAAMVSHETSILLGDQPSHVAQLLTNPHRYPQLSPQGSQGSPGSYRRPDRPRSE